MRIKLDENLPAELADDLRAAGHDADTVVAEHLAGEPDLVIAEAARRATRVLFTLDKGLGDPRRYPPSQHQGIVLFRLTTSGRLGVRNKILAALPRLIRRRSLAGRLVVVTESSIRIRP
jgi:predicted nuclease of predicted toxin-antitoxin system